MVINIINKVDTIWITVLYGGVWRIVILHTLIEVDVFIRRCGNDISVIPIIVRVYLFSRIQ